MMNGIEKCEMFRAIRKRLCEDNGIPFLEEECPTPNKYCIGTCPKCDYWLDELNKSIDKKRQKGEVIDYGGVKEVYESYLKKIDYNPNIDIEKLLLTDYLMGAPKIHRN